MTPLLFKTLKPGDEAALEAFLVHHAETSMFLRSNVRNVGLEFRPQPRHATYVAALEQERIVAVAAHAWNGNLLLQAPIHLEAVVRATVDRSGREVRGLLGPLEQVQAARHALGLSERATHLEGEEELFALDLADLIVPEALARGQVLCRRPREEELEMLITWRVAYSMEALRTPDSPALRDQSDLEIRRSHEDGVDFVLEADGRLVAYSCFNAHLPDIVQIGGVWTPPALRGRGYARSVVAGSLLHARSRGVGRSLLFTPKSNIAAQTAYKRIGYRVIGEYGLMLF